MGWKSDWKPRTDWKLVLLAGLVLGAFAFALGFSVAPTTTPDSLARQTPASSIAVAATSYKDARTVQVIVEQSAPQTLASGADGVLTASTCAEGKPMQSGISSFSVDGVPLINLATSTPLWRDLKVGDAGKDVQALQVELTRLGHSADATGTVSADTIAAYLALVAKQETVAGLPAAIERNRILWLPNNEAVVLKCAVSLGSKVSAGQPMVEFPPRAAGAKVTNIPHNAAAGERQIVVDGSSFAVSSVGRIEDPEALVALARLPSHSSAQSSAGQGTFAAKYELTQAISVLGVPPGAIFGVDSASGCVSSGGGVHRVTIVGSQLGITFVAGEGAEHLTEVDLHQNSAAQCD